MGSSQARPAAGGEAGVRTLKVALLGCGGVGSEVYRLLGRQAADLEARIGVPLEVAGVAVRRPGRQRGVEVDPAAAHRRRHGAGHQARRGHRGRGHRGHRAGPVAAARRHEERQVGGLGQQGAARRGRRHAAPGRPRRRHRPVLRGGRGRGDPAAAPAARVTGRGRGAAGARDRQRHDQLHPGPDGHLRGRLHRRAGGGAGTRLRRAGPDGGHRGLRRGRQGRDPGQPGLPHRGHRRRRVPGGDHRGHPGRHRQRPGARPRGQAARHLRAQRRRGVGPGAPGDDPARAPAGRRAGGLQRGVRGGRVGRAADVLRRGRGRDADRERGARRRRRGGARTGSPGPAARTRPPTRACRCCPWGRR